MIDAARGERTGVASHPLSAVRSVGRLAYEF